jgi:hypothetical protein
VWCAYNPRIPFQIPQQVEEGLCQLVSHKFTQSLLRSLQYQAARDGGAGWEAKLLRFTLHAIESDPGSIYGDGFREAAQHEAEMSIQVLLEHVIANRGCFPSARRR